MGGLYGHMSHIHEDLDLSFNNIIDILQNLSEFRIEPFEKMDGQNINFTVDSDDNIRLARNKGNIQAGGLSTAEYSAMWKDHPAQESFMRGFEAIQAVLRVLSSEEKQSLFATGNRYQNAEIVYPEGKNIIKYDAPMIRLHEAAILFDRESGLQVENDREAFAVAKKLGDIIGHLKVAVRGEEWQIRKPNNVVLNVINRTHFETAASRLETLAGYYVTRPISDWVESKIRPDLLQQGLNENVINHVVNAMLRKQGAMTAVQIKKLVPKDQKSIVSQYATKLTAAKRIKEKTADIEMIINDFAMELLRDIPSEFVNNHNIEVQRIQRELQQSITTLQHAASAGDMSARDLLSKQMPKLGSVSKLTSSLEGIVFQYPKNSGRIYKLTGAFAMTNQLIGRATRMNVPSGPLDKTKAASQKIALIPMSAKPYHKGHHMQVRHASATCDHVYVYVSPTDRQRKGELPVFASSLKTYWRDHIIPSLPDNVTAITTGYSMFGLNHHPLASPVSAVYAHLESAESAGSNNTFYIYSDEKDTGNAFPEKSVIKSASSLHANKQIKFPGVEDKNSLPRVASGTEVRKAVSDNNFDTFRSLIPDFMSTKDKRSLFTILRMPESKMGNLMPISMG